jgi:glutaredoxin
MQTLILYSKSGCHLCEGLQEKLEQIQSESESGLSFQLEIRDIAQQEQWLQAYQYEVPVLFHLKQEADDTETPIPRPSPRLSAGQLAQFLQPYLRSPS